MMPINAVVPAAAWRLNVILMLLGGASLAQAQTAVPPAAGDGLTTNTAYQITELGNLVWLQQQLWPAFQTPNPTLGKYYKLMNDIDASITSTWNDAETDSATLEGFFPIGYSNDERGFFKGIFDGNGHKITNLTINRPRQNQALFGEMWGEIRNLGVTGKVSALAYVGLLAGVNKGRIVNCQTTGTVTLKGENLGVPVGYYGGGLVGWNSGQLFDSRSSVTLTGCKVLGGLTGMGGGQIIRCSADGLISGEEQVGGLVGNSGSLADCHASASVLGKQYLGGLVGNFGGTMTNCYATGSVTSNLYGNVGGLIGWAAPSTTRPNLISNCYATGAVTGHSWYVGGLIGYCQLLPIINCQARGAVNGQVYTGGLIGMVEYGSTLPTTATITNCEASGPVTATSTWTGGLIGSFAADMNPAPSISNCRTSSTVNGLTDVGGLIGAAQSYSVSDCQVSGVVTGTRIVGGLIGEGGTVTRCSASCTINGQNYTGGLIGLSDYPCVESTASGTVNGRLHVGGLAGSSQKCTNCSASGNVSGLRYVGGLVGTSQGAEDCHASGDVSATSDYVGGLIGNASGSFNRSYATGSVTSPGNCIGGLIGRGKDAQLSVTQCYASGRGTGAHAA